MGARGTARRDRARRDFRLRASTDGAHITQPTVDGQARAMQLALDSAASRQTPSRTSRARHRGHQNDAVETAAIRRVFGARADRVAVSSSQSMHGHLLGAATPSSRRAVAARTGDPPTLNLHTGSGGDSDTCPRRRRDQDIELAMTNSFAFGGTNAVLICRRA
jgi:3-oxoacyl-(acyl-carrier-protein) synthase